MKHRRITTASWMLVPIALAAPALVSGLSVWFDWGPQWTALCIVLAGASLALILDFRRALRWGLAGACAGILTCPLLLLLRGPDWVLFAIWIAAVSVLPALLAPLLFGLPQSSDSHQQPQPLAPRDAETLEQLAVFQPSRHNQRD